MNAIARNTVASDDNAVASVCNTIAGYDNAIAIVCNPVVSGNNAIASRDNANALAKLSEGIACNTIMSFDDAIAIPSLPLNQKSPSPSAQTLAPL
ncbi:hypothetical protein ACQ4N7_19200 [Nodosilinea sp. AN01ver1]|uniref:hypothetical protein n=1 Tax=Nodosilinea sp. AN01ver1 TaxID=3423362 RepID=UPI003D315BC6